MFNGIIECTTQVQQLNRKKNNLYITFKNPFFDQIKINQSISHNGICLTLIEVNKKNYSVMASEETLRCTNLYFLKIKDEVNLERGMKLHERVNGHLVQGHVDTIAKIVEINKKNGSWLFSFKSKKKLDSFVVEKGSIAVNGISLTIKKCTNYIFSVSVIPYTYEKTNFRFMKVGNFVNVEYDILGKYIRKFLFLKMK
ncbi:MAG: riboflavin synthase [Flavobacteriales bacterium]|jgi:riboflavin synthase|uniref:riboflavin synthase n=1 Tax=Blattabacterium sp. (Mastotermes darwiniensis) TaxID=39768 RepID=UPI000231DF00|nr:riboflavin synthase [Blattabacterium sp. (Mastotermes darwiniensis)]AER40820.1 riboflavin synthase subunit alpha [Blattabacterium sp. (Mastotermes darwiniensis) str. MADAR]MDR1804667.1 riboflavin synthase [Flavobacteriales bacterium]